MYWYFPRDRCAKKNLYFAKQTAFFLWKRYWMTFVVAQKIIKKCISIKGNQLKMVDRTIFVFLLNMELSQGL